VCVTALYNVAVQIGTNRIVMSGSKFHYPMGRPDLPPEDEKEWRLRQTRATLAILEKPVEGVTVFTQQDLFP
jgi:hypothetical protein